MHIPDGFISPKVYIPLYGISAGLWAYGLRKIKKKLNEQAIPFVASLTAFCFVAMMIAIPLPGGTTAHVTSVALLAVVFDIWTAFLSVSLVLFINAVLFGNGGITTLPVNALGIGFIGSVVAFYTFKTLSRWKKTVALFAAGWLSINISALAIAVVLGVQPLMGRSEDGSPLFFPFGLSVTIPALIIPHLLIGIGEGILTVVVYKFLERTFSEIFHER